MQPKDMSEDNYMVVHGASPTNIVVLHKNTGTISNEKGVFSLDISQLEQTDTLRKV